MKKSMTDLVLKYQKTGEGESELFNELFLVIYEIPRRFYRGGSEECSDFLMYIYPRLKRFVKSFVYKGIPFEHFLRKNLYCQYKNYFKRSKDADTEWDTFSDAGFWDVHEFQEWARVPVDRATFSEKESKGYSDKVKEVFKIDETGQIQDESMKRRVLYCFLKNAELCCEEVIQKISRITGFCAGWLSDCVASLRGKIYNREGVYRIFHERRNRAYFKLNVLKKRYHGAIDAETKRMYQERINRQLDILRRGKTQLEKTRRVATNREVAQIVGVPKGSVDSGMYGLKKKLKALYS